MKIISWNVNGLRAVIGKGFYESVASLDADVICLQEIKMQKGQCEVTLDGYEQVLNYADRKGYSGTAVFSRVPMIGHTINIGVDEHDHEGRVITCEFQDFYLVCCYTPNSQNELKRLDYRMRWEDDFRKYLVALDVSAGFIDSFRHFYPDVTGAYSWWSYIGGARSRNAGWRIDYFIVSEKLREKMIDSKIHPQIMGSDHCPVELDIKASETGD